VPVCVPSGASVGSHPVGPGLTGDSGAFSLGSLAGGFSAFISSVMFMMIVSRRRISSVRTSSSRSRKASRSRISDMSVLGSSGRPAGHTARAGRR
jgi:hypothetical protein